MSVSRIEALADAIMHEEGWFPGSRSNRNRNPGNMRSGIGAVGTDADGYAIFRGLADGYTALCDDLLAKCTGHTTTGLGPGSTLAELIAAWAPVSDGNNPSAYASAVVVWMGGALGERVTPDFKLRDIYSAAAASEALVG